MNLLLFTHNLNGGGAEKTVRTLSTYFNACCKGITSYICVVVDDPNLPEYPEKVIVMRHQSAPADSKFRKGLNVLAQIQEMKEIKRKYQIDVCVSFLSGADIINVFSKVGEREIISVRNEESRFVHNILQKWYRKIAYLKCDRIIGVSQRTAADVVQYFGIRADKVTAIPNAIEPAAVADVQDTAYLAFIMGRYVYINVARLFSAKGQDMLLRAFATVHASHPETVLALVGDGPERDALEVLALDLGIADAVYFAGMQRCPAWYMQRADAFVLSSHAEGMPNAILEAMQAGLPVISTDCGAREILAPDSDPLYQTDHIDVAEYGVLTSIGNERSLVEAMQLILDDSALADGYRSHNEDRVSAYTMSAIMSAWIREIERCMACK